MFFTIATPERLTFPTRRFCNWFLDLLPKERHIVGFLPVGRGKNSTLTCGANPWLEAATLSQVFPLSENPPMGNRQHEQTAPPRFKACLGGMKEEVNNTMNEKASRKPRSDTHLPVTQQRPFDPMTSASCQHVHGTHPTLLGGRQFSAEPVKSRSTCPGTYLNPESSVSEL